MIVFVRDVYMKLVKRANRRYLLDKQWHHDCASILSTFLMLEATEERDEARNNIVTVRPNAASPCAGLNTNISTFQERNDVFN